MALIFVIKSELSSHDYWSENAENGQKRKSDPWIVNKIVLFFNYQVHFMQRIQEAENIYHHGLFLNAVAV